MEKLIINKFAGIDSLEVELNEINIFIGPQATGKSIIAKLFYYFKSFFNEIAFDLINEKSYGEIEAKQINRFLDFFPPENWSKNNFLIKYRFSNSYIIIKEIGTKIELDFSNDIKDIILNNNISIGEIGLLNPWEPLEKYNQQFKKLFSDKITFSQIFIPAGRSFFSNIQSNIFSLLNANESLDPFIVMFGSFYEKLKKHFNKNIFNLDTKSNKIINNILNSKYKRENQKDYLIHSDFRKVNLSSASSGQQEIFPLLLIIEFLLSDSFRENDAVLYIEEPEAHLSPNAQKMVVQLLARLFNADKKKFQIIITTHSPYILSSFNNLMYAGELVNKNDTDNIYKVIPEKEILSPEKVFAYSLNSKQEIKSIIDTETNLISQNILDDVSDKISIEFGKLLDLDV